MEPENINSLYSLVQTLHAPLLSSNQLATNYLVEGFLHALNGVAKTYMMGTLPLWLPIPVIERRV